MTIYVIKLRFDALKGEKMNLVYLRLSTDHQDFSNQLKKIQNYCIQNNIKIDYIIKDISAGFTPYKKFIITEKYLLEHNITNIIVYNISRISRSADCLCFFKNFISRLNVNIIECYKNKDDLDFYSKNFISWKIFTNITVINRKDISRVTKIGLQELKDKGVILGAKKKDIDKEMMDTVVNLYKNGVNMYQICKRTNLGRRLVERILDDAGLRQRPKTSKCDIDDMEENEDYKYLIWSDKKMGLPTKEICAKYKINKETIDYYIKLLKGGGNF